MPIEIESPRLLIQAPRLEDARELHDAVEESFEELKRFMPWCRQRKTLEENHEFLQGAIARFELNQEFHFNLRVRSTGRLVGCAAFCRFDLEVPRYEIGYWCRTLDTGNGYITEAASTMADFAFAKLGAKRVEIHTSAVNTRSRAVALRAGFSLEATLHDHRREEEGGLGDTLIYAKLADTPTSRHWGSL